MRSSRVLRAQSAVEYTLMIVLASAALVGVFGYVRSAVTHRMKGGADGIGQGLRYPPP